MCLMEMIFDKKHYSHFDFYYSSVDYLCKRNSEINLVSNDDFIWTLINFIKNDSENGQMIGWISNKGADETVRRHAGPQSSSGGFPSDHSY